MIFQHTLEAVLSGRKTQTRRRVLPGHAPVYNDKRAIIAVEVNGRAKWAVGKTYAVQPGRGEPQVARIRITGLGQQPVQDVSEADAIAEGHAGRVAFLAEWVRIHGKKHADADAWVVEFELVEA